MMMDCYCCFYFYGFLILCFILHGFCTTQTHNVNHPNPNSISETMSCGLSDHHNNNNNKLQQQQVESESVEEEYYYYSKGDGDGRRRILGGLGSSPPRCAWKCGGCSPCKAVHVAVPPGNNPVTMEYYPEAWRCKCGDKLYIP
ncbi:EPIDERMAL PATTERNING FACTOR-like protein 6 isoform X2 [Andrographis paniculata]|uniref:EPIDERMAL PATTERNING FACTOR-like protein 6 isoform X2 n=1 Tax=Andrographis paniculata TaxID=175694 RepID=UPI0021E74BB6|nr:EPIDERMAL PATTERNING FACTOR-like protein 6 isoform X2 [Andrographis paniculata]